MASAPSADILPLEEQTKSFNFINIVTSRKVYDIDWADYLSQIFSIGMGINLGRFATSMP